MYTTTGDASVFFVFSGTNVNLFGGKRPQNGFYQIAVDTKVYTPVNGQSDEPGLFQTSLFSSIPLSDASHTVQLKNANAGSKLDLDYVSANLAGRIAEGARSDWEWVFLRYRSLGRRELGRITKNSSRILLTTTTHLSHTSLQMLGRPIRIIWERFREGLASEFLVSFCVVTFMLSPPAVHRPSGVLL